MPRFFFDLVNGDTVVDYEGSELADMAAARHEATISAREIMAERIRQGISANLCSFRVRNEEGGVAFTLPFHEAIQEGDC